MSDKIDIGINDEARAEIAAGLKRLLPTPTRCT